MVKYQFCISGNTTFYDFFSFALNFLMMTEEVLRFLKDVEVAKV